ncbi:MAG: lipid-binding SYLF domain-containing protein [Gammaproteobacteria bacterium]|nr:lipid-binding SYLF domain-containing protein [Gammaproteobacteria bacterium]
MHRTSARSLLLTVLLSTATTAQAGWNPLAKEKAEDQPAATNKAAETIAAFKNKDPGIKVFFDKAYGYAVFPTVGKGGMGIGGAYGKGEVYERGTQAGTSSVTQLTIGFQLGGQAYSEIIFFKDKTTLDNFKSGNFEFSAQASAVAITAGASADADYSNGVAIFTLAKGGLMYEASVGGQKFSYTSN